MAYKRRYIYHFKTELDIGIIRVPFGRMILIENFQGSVRLFIKISDWNLLESSTILDAVILGSLGEVSLKIGNEINLKSLSIDKEMQVPQGTILNIKE